MKRPRIICHMVTSVDGRIKPNDWPMKEVSRQYEKCHKMFKGDAWLVGRTSMQGFSSAKISKLPRASSDSKKTDFVAKQRNKTFAVVIDPSGKCRWQKNDITGDHVIEILSERVSFDYLAHLQHKQVSYIFAGKREIDLNVAMKKLRKLFGIRTLLLEGGGIVNGTFLKAGLIDELSQLVLPLADGSLGTPALFDVEKGKVTTMKLKKVKRLAGDTLWLRYLCNRT